MPRPTAPTSETARPPYTVDREAFEAFRDEMRRELAPAGILHSLVVDQFAMAAERLRRAAEWEETAAPGDPAWTRYHAQAERTFWKAMAELRRIERAQRAGAGPVVAPKAQAAPRFVVQVKEPTVGAATGWRSRIDRGPSGRLKWAVLRGTDVKADDVMSLIEEGWPEAEILARYQGLTDADIRACRECDAEGEAGARYFEPETPTAQPGNSPGRRPDWLKS